MNGNAERITAEEFLRFNQHLLGLVRTRVPLDQGLARMAAEAEGGRLKSFTASVAKELGRGRQLSEVLERNRPQIPDYYIALVRAGEKGGSLAEILHHIVGETRRQIDHRRALATSLAYPTVILLLACAVFLVIGIYVLPPFKTAFDELGAMIPEPTATMFVILETVGRYPIYFAIGILAFVGIAAGFLSGRIGRPLRDALLLNIPIVGRMVFNDVTITFMRCMGFLLQRDVPMTEALELAGSVMQNVLARRYVGQIRAGIERGEGFSDMLERYPYFPKSTRWIIRLAEERGDLPETLLELADFHEAKQDHLRTAFQGMIEPVLVLLLGIIVGAVVIMLYTPLFSIPKVIGK